MAQINFARREISCKIVYYGPGLSGKTTNLEMIHKKTPENVRGQLTSIATEGDRTLFFDFMPLDLGEIAGMKIKLQLYTVPGQIYYNSTRKLVLQGVDGVVFVADSNKEKLEENIYSFNNLQDNLKEMKLDLEEIPHIIQFNKRDLSNAIPTNVLNEKLNIYNAPTFEAVAINGEGVLSTLKSIAKLVIDELQKRYSRVEEKEPATHSEKEAKFEAVPIEKIVNPPSKIEEVKIEPTNIVREKTDVENVAKPSIEKSEQQANEPQKKFIALLSQTKTLSPTDTNLTTKEKNDSYLKWLIIVIVAISIVTLILFHVL